MLKHAGRSIKRVVSIWFVLSCVIAILVGAIMVLAGLSNQQPGLCFLGIVVTAVLVFFNWLGNLVMYAYGEMAEAVLEINTAVQELKASNRSGL